MTENEREQIRHLVEAIASQQGEGDSLQLPGWQLSDWQRLLLDAETITLRDGEILLRRGETSNDLYFVVRGRLEVSVPQADSISISPVIPIEPGSVVGEIAFLDNGGRSASVWSRGISELLRLRRASFDSFKDTEPTLACDLLWAIGRIVAIRLRKKNGAAKRGPYAI